MKYLTDKEHLTLRKMVLFAPVWSFQWFDFMTNDIYICHICEREINNKQDNYNDHGFKHLKLSAFL